MTVETSDQLLIAAFSMQFVGMARLTEVRTKLRCSGCAIADCSIDPSRSVGAQQMAVTGQAVSTRALKGSTEEAQFDEAAVQTKA